MNNKPYFTLLWVLTLVVCGVMIFIGISLIPFFHQIGLAATVVVFIFLAYATIGAGGFLAFKLYQWWIYRNVISIGEVVATVDTRGKIVDHLSATHEQAKIPRLLPAGKDEPPLDLDEQDMIGIYNGGATLEQLADSFGLKYNKVQRIISDARKKGLIRRQ